MTDTRVSSSPTSPPNLPIFFAIGAIYCVHMLATPLVQPARIAVKNFAHPCLTHAQKREPNANQKRARASKSNGQPFRILPSCHIVTAQPRPEVEMLDEQDDCKREGPVSQDR